MVLFPRSIEEVREVLRLALEHRLSVIPCGLGSFLHLGFPPRRYDLALSLRFMDRLLDYEAADMTVSAQSGLTLARLQEALAGHGQWLPLDPPLAERVTLGGMISANLSGPLRLSQGLVRDFLIGLKVVLADGTVVKGGGKVVKNVAGYDLPKLYCGSLGTLGIIVEATFKVRPRPGEIRLLSFTLPSPKEAMELVLKIGSSELQPLFLELFQDSEENTTLFVGLGGIAEEIAYQKERLSSWAGEAKEWSGQEQEEQMRRLQNFPLAEGALLGFRASLLPTEVAPFVLQVREEAKVRELGVRFLAHAGNGVVLGQLFGEATSGSLLSLVDWLRALAKKPGGYLVVESVDPLLKDRIDVWGYTGEAFFLMKRIKEKLDPQGLLSPGRFVGGI